MLEGTRQLKSTFVIHDEVLRWLGMRFLVIVDGTRRKQLFKMECDERNNGNAIIREAD